MVVDTLASAFIGHMVGDYLLQTDWMAANKKRASWPCFVHCVIWALSVCVFASWSWEAFLVLFVTHFIQDRTYLVHWWMALPWKSQVNFMTPPLAPWSVIVVDNTWHLVQIWFVWKFVV